MSAQKKRITVVVALVITIGLLVWQLSGLIRSDLGSPVVVIKHPQSKLTVHHAKPMIGNVPKQSNWKKNAALTTAERRYLQLASEIQKAKMHHQLLQQQVAIAEAEKRLVLSHHQTMGLASSDSVEIGAWPKAGEQSDEDLHLVYLAKLSGGHWQATLQKGSQLVYVERGSDLGDGRHVAAIIGKGLWLQDAKGVRWLGFSGEPAPHGAAAASVNFAKLKQHKIAQKKRRHFNAHLRTHVSPVTPADTRSESSTGPIGESRKPQEEAGSPGQARGRRENVARGRRENVARGRREMGATAHASSSTSRDLIAGSRKPQQKAHPQLTSDEMLFLEQPSEGVTLLTSVTQANPDWLQKLIKDKQVKSSFLLNINGQDHLALGLFKTENTAKLRALAFKDAFPHLKVTPMPVELLQKAVMHDKTTAVASAKQAVKTKAVG